MQDQVAFNTNVILGVDVIVLKSDKNSEFYIITITSKLRHSNIMFGISDPDVEVDTALETTVNLIKNKFAIRNQGLYNMKLLSAVIILPYSTYNALTNTKKNRV